MKEPEGIHTSHDDHLMRRFLVGDVTNDERTRIEDAFADDADYFEALCRTEEDLIRGYVRNELSDDWRARVERSLPQYPDRRRRIRELEALLPVIIAAPAVSPAPAMSQSWRYLGVAASVAITILGGVWWLRSSSPGTGAPSVESQSAPTSVTFRLVPGLTRADTAQATVLRVPHNVAEVRLQISLPVRVESPRVSMRRVGGAAVALPPAPSVATAGDGVILTWVVPASALTRGDYLVTVSGETSPGVRETAASAFFSVVE